MRSLRSPLTQSSIGGRSPRPGTGLPADLSAVRRSQPRRGARDQIRTASAERIRDRSAPVRDGLVGSRPAMAKTRPTYFGRHECNRLVRGSSPSSPTTYPHKLQFS
jgi:hypothetical protein